MSSISKQNRESIEGCHLLHPKGAFIFSFVFVMYPKLAFHLYGKQIQKSQI